MTAYEPNSYDAFAQHIGIEMLGIQEGRAQARLFAEDVIPEVLVAVGVSQP
jgi:hypothetical protein